MITGIGQIHISVTDLDAAVGFYHGKLGLPLLFTVPEHSMAFLQCGATRLYLARPESPEFHSAPLLYFDVDDILIAYDELRTKGVEFLGDPHVVHRTDATELWVAFTRDPDGTHIALMQERPIRGIASP